MLIYINQKTFLNTFWTYFSLLLSCQQGKYHFILGTIGMDTRRAARGVTSQSGSQPKPKTPSTPKPGTPGTPKATPEKTGSKQQNPVLLEPDTFIALLSDDRVASKLNEIFKRSLADVKSELENLKRTVSAKDEIIQKQQDQIKDLEAKNKNLEQRNQEIFATLDEHEQYSRRNCLRIWTDIRETRDEDTDKMVLDHAVKIGADIQPHDISRSHRVGKPKKDRARPIIVRFTTYNKRRHFYSLRKNDDKIFVSEDLTKRRAYLLYLARGLRRKKLISQCWSSDGKIRIRKLDQDDNPGEVITIEDESDLKEFEEE